MDWLEGIYPVLMLLPAVIGIYCAAQALRDYKAKRYGWSVAGALCALLVIASYIPIETHAVKLEFPPAAVSE